MVDRRDGSTGAGGMLKNLFSKFRSNSSRESDHRDEAYYDKLLHPENTSRRDFSVYSIRVVIMRDERLQYDSDTYQPTHAKLQEMGESGERSFTCSSPKTSLCKSSSVSVSTSLVDRPKDRLTSTGPGTTTSLPASYKGGGPVRNGMTREIAVYTELMFGAVGGKRKDRQTKIHFIKSFNQLLVTKVFYPQRQTQPICPIVDSSAECQERTSSILGFKLPTVTKSRSQSLNIPRNSRDSVTPSPPHSGRSSPSTMTKRQGLLNPLPPSKVSKNSRLKGPKFAVGVVFNWDCCLDAGEGQRAQRQLEDFLFSHFPIIDWKMSALKMSVEEAITYNDRQKKLSEFHAANGRFVNDINDLYSAPRIQKPVHLSIIRNPDARRTVMSSFVGELVHAINTVDTKDTDFFLSRLLTSILVHHTGWMQSFCGHMLPAGGGLDGSQSLSAPAHNPQMDQFWGLYGSVNTPGRICRTVVSGQSKVDICRILYILTYFIRCKDLVRESSGDIDPDVYNRPRLGALSVTDHHYHLQANDLTSSYNSDMPSSPSCRAGSSSMQSLSPSVIGNMQRRDSISSPLDSRQSDSSGGSDLVCRCGRKDGQASCSGDDVMSRCEECCSHVSSDSGMGGISRGVVQTSGVSTPLDSASLTEECSEFSLQPSSGNESSLLQSWDNIDPEKSLLLAKMTIDLTPDVTVEGERQHLEDGGYHFEKIRTHRFDPDHFSLRRLDAIDQQFANSLFAGYSEKYLSDFVLHGTMGPTDSFRMSLLKDLEAVLDCNDDSWKDNTAMCILADTSTWLCEVVAVTKVCSDSDTVEYYCYPTAQQSAACVKKLLNATKTLHELGTPAEFCILQLEGLLKDLCQKGQLVAQFIAENSKKSLNYLLQDMNTTFCINTSDREIMLAIASAQDRTIEQLLTSEGNMCWNGLFNSV